ncbi:MAG: glucose-1-phosphate cytidylyltransferase [Candidatus Korobacteraceae bacterium]|jgi:glucose-1-phosphate cytidylyltransferase
MKAVILAGGLGSRLSEETTQRPKPMVEVGGFPMLWHIMKIYSAHNVNDFIVCLGYKGYVIKEYFANYFLHSSDVTFDLAKNSMKVHQHFGESWRVTLIDTGGETQTGGRIKRILPYVSDEESFCLTYGDGVADVDVTGSIEFHKQHGRLATLTAVQPAGRFGSLVMEGNAIVDFQEKPAGDGQWINGGFFVLSPKVGEYIAGDATPFEQDSLKKIAKDDQLRAFRHRGFWQPMDTLRDKNHLEELWAAGKAAWKTWE